MARARTESPSQTDNRAPDPELLPPHLRERRERIVRAAIELLEHGEYEKIQVRDVAERADVALGTLYRYFTSKEHLYAAALLEWSRSFDFRTREGAERGRSDEDRIRNLLSRAVRAFERCPQMLRAEIAMETSDDENARAIYERFAERHQSVMTAALREMSAADAAAVVETTNVVMGSRLRSWALGRCSIADVHHSVARTVDLIFSPPPTAP